MSASQAPIPEKSSGTYVIGIVVLAALGGGLLYWKSQSTAPTTPTATVTTPPPETQAPPPPPPPPPPPVEEVTDASADAAKSATPMGTGGTNKGPCSGKCGDGKASSALTSALQARAQSARGCYNRALRTSEVSGKMTVSVQVGQSGAVCGASIVNDTVGSGEVSSCVLSRFKGQSFPPPESGCVVVNIPINFEIKQ